MRIKKEEMLKIREILSKLELSPSYNEEKSTLFFPLDSEEIAEERDTGVVLLETKKEGFVRFIKPGITLFSLGQVYTKLSYATIEYAIPFKLEQHISYFPTNPFNEEELKYLSQFECLMIPKQQVLLSFDL
jgi:hypothetical protein